MHRIACLVIGAMFMASGAFAQVSPAAERVDLGDAAVRAELWTPSTLSPTAATIVLDEAAIAASGAVNLAELLQDVPGLQVLDNGYAGSVRTAKIRGGSGGHVVVVVDGVRLNDARTGSVDLSGIPLAGVQQVEVLRSGASALYGSDAIAGVIYVSTARTGSSGLSVNMSTTAYPLAYAEGQDALLAAQSVSASGRLALGAATFSASAGLDRAADILPVAEDASSYDLTRNTGLLGGYVDLGAIGAVFGGIGKLSAFGRNSEKGVPGSTAYPSPNASQSEQEARVAASWGIDTLADGTVMLQSDLSTGWSRLNYKDPDTWGGPTDDTHESLAIDANLRSELLMGPAIIRLGLAGSINTASSSSLGDKERYFAGAYLVPELAFGNFTLAPSLRYDMYSDFTAGLSYGLGASWSAGSLKLSANAASAYKAPSFNDLYYVDPWMHGDPDLDAERGWSAEMGIDFGSLLGTTEFSLSVSPYFRYVMDMISWVYDSGTGISTATNIAKAAYLGADLAATVTSGPVFSSLSYSYTLAKNLSDDSDFSEADRLAYVPLHAVRLEAGVQFGLIRASMDASYWMGRLASGNAGLPDLLLLGLSAEAEALPGTFLGLKAVNLLDEAYVENAGFPMPGLAITASLRLVR